MSRKHSSTRVCLVTFALESCRETKTTQPDQDCLSTPRFSRHRPANDDEGTLYVPFGITDVQGRLASVSRSIDQVPF